MDQQLIINEFEMDVPSPSPPASKPSRKRPRRLTKKKEVSNHFRISVSPIEKTVPVTPSSFFSSWKLTLKPNFIGAKKQTSNGGYKLSKSNH
jgi:hypothetical protein